MQNSRAQSANEPLHSISTKEANHGLPWSICISSCSKYRPQRGHQDDRTEASKATSWSTAPHLCKFCSPRWESLVFRKAAFILWLKELL